MIIIGIGLVAFALIWVQRYLYVKIWNKNLKVAVSFGQSGVTEGEYGEIVQVIENKKRLSLPMLRVGFQTSRDLKFEDEPGSVATDQYYRNEVFQINGFEKITRTIPFEASKRGYYHIKNIDVAGTDLFFMKEKIYSMATNCYLYVYPIVFRSREFFTALQKLNGDIIVKRHLIEDPFEYRGIREYQPFDDMRSVNWKATARTSELKVNQKNYTAMQTVRIFLNTEDLKAWKKDWQMEKAIQMALGVAESVLKQGVRVEFYTNGKDMITGEPTVIAGGAGASQLEAIRKALARIDLAKEPESFAKLFETRVLDNKEGYFNVIVSLMGEASFRELLRRCDEEKVEFRWFYPVLSMEKESAVEYLTETGDLKYAQFITF